MSTESPYLNVEENNKTLKDKYQGIVEKIIPPSAEDSQIIEEIKKYLLFFKEKLTEGNSHDIQNIIFFLEAFKSFLECSIITYKIKNHWQRREWLMSLSPDERIFFDNNRLRINKVFSLLFTLDFLITGEENESNLQKYSSQFNNLRLEFEGEGYDKLSNQAKIELVNRLKEFCRQVLVEIKKSFKIE